MAFTWLGTLATDLDKVRFHIADTDENAAWLQDATINALLASEASVGGAVIACIRHIIAQLSRPDFKADWLTVSNKTAIEAWRALLDDKRREFGLSVFTADVTHVYRADSLQTEEPDYDD